MLGFSGCRIVWSNAVENLPPTGWIYSSYGKPSNELSDNGPPIQLTEKCKILLTAETLISKRSPLASWGEPSENFHETTRESHEYFLWQRRAMKRRFWRSFWAIIKIRHILLLEFLQEQCFSGIWQRSKKGRKPADEGKKKRESKSEPNQNIVKISKLMIRNLKKKKFYSTFNFEPHSIIGITSDNNEKILWFKGIPNTSQQQR